MIRFHENLHKDFSKPLSLYFQGKTPPDVYDEKDGAILDVDLRSRRASKLSMFDRTKGSQQIFNELIEFYARPVEDCRQVIQQLLEADADANRRYQVEPGDISKWTPTLFAAQIGDIDLFKMLVEYAGPNRGDPELTLMPPTRFEQFDALWIAIDHKRHDIVSYLTKRKMYSSF